MLLGSDSHEAVVDTVETKTLRAQWDTKGALRP